MCDWSRRAPPAASFRLACASARHPRRRSARGSRYPLSRHGRARHRPRPNCRRAAPWCHRPARPRRTPARCARTIPQTPRRATAPAPSRARCDWAPRHRGWSPGTTAHPAAWGRRRTGSHSPRTVSGKSRNRSFHRPPRIDRAIAAVTVVGRDRRAHEREVEPRLHSSPPVLGPPAPVKLRPVAEPRPWSFVLARHLARARSLCRHGFSTTPWFGQQALPACPFRLFPNHDHTF